FAPPELRYEASREISVSYRDRFDHRSRASSGSGVFIIGEASEETVDGPVTVRLKRLSPGSDEVMVQFQLEYIAPAAGLTAQTRHWLTAAISTRFGMPVTLLVPRPETPNLRQGLMEIRFIMKRPDTPRKP